MVDSATWFSTLHAEGLICRARAVRILDLLLFFSKLVSTSSWLTELEAIFLKFPDFLAPKASCRGSKNASLLSLSVTDWQSSLLSFSNKFSSRNVRVSSKKMFNLRFQNTLVDILRREKKWRASISRHGNGQLSLYLESWINLIICTCCKKEKKLPKKAQLTGMTLVFVK